MGKSKAQAIKFGPAAKMMKEPHKRTRTGAYKTPNRRKAHGRTSPRCR